MAVDFIHLKVHSEYSLVDSIITHQPLLSALHSYGIPAVSVTDECNLFGAVKLYKSALKAGLKTIIGADFWVSDQTNEKNCFRLTLLAENQTGYTNLVELISKGYMEAERINGMPIIDIQWLTQLNMAGLIALSGGLEGHLGQLIQAGYDDKAHDALKWWLAIFATDSFFIELQRIGKENEEHYIHKALQLASHYQVPVVATNDVRFINQDDFDVHEVRVGIYEGYTLLDKERKSKYTEKQYLRSPEEMKSLFSDIPSAITNTVQIARRCNVTFKLGQPYLPQYDTPPNETKEAYLTRIAYEGLKKRLISIQGEQTLHDKTVVEKYHNRLQLELDVICEMGFPGYFLIVADFIQWAKNHHIPVGPGRGSGAGSLVAYALKITDIDPIAYGLLFERFLNPQRVSMPDFDIDFCMEGRDDVVAYVMAKYGAYNVSQIITYGTMAAKAVVRDVGRVLGYPFGLVDKIAKLIPNELGITLKQAYKAGSELDAFSKEEEAVDAILQVAMKLEGLTRSVGKHAAGVVIAPSKVTDFCPVYCEEGSKQLVSQFDKKDVEEVGLVKFDFLGLRNLTIIDNALSIVNRLRFQAGDNPIDINQIPMDDSATFELIKNANTTGIFQLESRGIKELIKRLQPDCFEEVIALVALYRPGPLGSGMADDFVNCKHGYQKVKYPHPALASVLQETYGTILYQEQVMQIAQILAGYSLGAADILRRAMGKKNPAEMAKQRQIFEKGCIDNNIDAQLASNIFDTMEEFAKYGFNKSHSAAYALISYQTAWLKAHYPAAFMAAALSSDMDNTDKVVGFIKECKQMGLEIVSPHINHSEYGFTVNDNHAVVYGLGAIKGVGHAAIESILDQRKRYGVYQNIHDLACRVDLRKVNKKVLEALTCAGALDELANHRNEIYTNIEPAVKAAEQMKVTSKAGQEDMFGLAIPKDQKNSEFQFKLMEADHWSFRKLLKYEKSVLGLCLSGHPMNEFTQWIQNIQLKTVKDILKLSVEGRQQVYFAGMISKIDQRRTKRGGMIGILTMEDEIADVEVVMFESLLTQIKNHMQVDDIVVIEGQAEIDGFSGNIRVSANDIMLLETKLKQAVTAVHLTLSLEKAVENDVLKIKQLLGPPFDSSCHENASKTSLSIKLQNHQASELNLPAQITLDQQNSLLTQYQKLKQINCIKQIHFHFH